MDVRVWHCFGGNFDTIFIQFSCGTPFIHSSHFMNEFTEVERQGFRKVTHRQIPRLLFYFEDGRCEEKHFWNWLRGRSDSESKEKDRRDR